MSTITIILLVALAAIAAATLIARGVAAHRAQQRAAREALERLGFRPCPEEKVWLGLAVTFTFSTFLLMPLWHLYGSQNPPSESYRISPAQFQAKVNAFVEQYTAGQEEREEKGIPIVHPEPGSDVYLMAKSWVWYPILELEKGQTYRIHLSSVDVQHGLSIYPLNMNFMAHVAKMLSYRVITMQARGLVPNYEASMTKLFSSELGQRIARTAMKVTGLYGQLSVGSPWAASRGRYGETTGEWSAEDAAGFCRIAALPGLLHARAGGGS